ncbi:SAM-dependent methyltransferase [Streptomyces sp. NPDC094437]|uniref:SAM-dependent methyltransferase n=1 Tax=Streptomyces sp. NPDC094437 TaxID=3366060 RepID=UPI00381B68F2
MTQPTDIRGAFTATGLIRPLRVLDLFCCQGGAARGYADAGWDVTGVDKDPQPRYPYRFIQASPPCQLDTECQRIRGNSHPDLIAPTRTALESTGRPWVIENVRGALPKLREPVMLCGQMFALDNYRHRYFETGSGLTLHQPRHPVHRVPQAKSGTQFGLDVRRHRVFETSWGGGGDLVPPCWHRKGLLAFTHKGERAYADAMGCTWMTSLEARKAVPPAYTRWIARQYLTHEGRTAA